MRFFVLFIIFLCTANLLSAQRQYTLHWVAFKDKNDSPYSLFKPQEYLSNRAIERRQRFGIKIDSSDLPVNPKYIQAIQEKGLIVRHRLKWLNGAVVEASLEEIEKLKGLDFIKEMEPIGYARTPQKHDTRSTRPKNTDFRRRTDYYGYGQNQIEMLGGVFIHRMGYRGQGLWVGVIDAGFTQAHVTPAFDSMRLEHRLLGTHDFVEGDEYVYESASHGRDVLSTMAANTPYLLVGTAPDASYFLFKTEDENGEFVVEEYHWVAAAEHADSLGIDVINTSLGYSNFDDNMMTYAYDDMDGTYTPSAISADYAAQKGMLVVNSAGNEGGGKWKHITTPGDARMGLTVGAVDREGKPARFSSEGFPSLPFVKPNISARGLNAIVAAPARYDISYQSGTSFSSPIMAGMATSLWQSMPEIDNQQLIRSLEKYSSQANEPDFKQGYGVPNSFAVYQDIKGDAILLNDKYFRFNKITNKKLQFFAEDVKTATIEIHIDNAQGQNIVQTVVELTEENRKLWYYSVPNWENQSPGVYHITIQIGSKTYRGVATKA